MTENTEHEVALIVGAGRGVSASCARRFAAEGMQVAVAARSPDKSELLQLEKDHGVRRFACDAGDADSVAELFEQVDAQLGAANLVVHNIDGRTPEIFRKEIVEVDPELAAQVVRNGAFSAFLVGQQAARAMLGREPGANGVRGTIVFTNASAAFKGYPKSAAFAMACHAKTGLAQSMARELGPQGIHVAQVPIDAVVGNAKEDADGGDGGRGHWLMGDNIDDNMADPERIAELYLQLHRQHRSTWAFEVVVRPWLENW